MGPEAEVKAEAQPEKEIPAEALLKTALPAEIPAAAPRIPALSLVLRKMQEILETPAWQESR